MPKKSKRELQNASAKKKLATKRSSNSVGNPTPSEKKKLVAQPAANTAPTGTPAMRNGKAMLMTRDFMERQSLAVKANNQMQFEYFNQTTSLGSEGITVEDVIRE